MTKWDSSQLHKDVKHMQNQSVQYILSKEKSKKPHDHLNRCGKGT